MEVEIGEKVEDPKQCAEECPKWKHTQPYCVLHFPHCCSIQFRKTQGKTSFQIYLLHWYPFYQIKQFCTSIITVSICFSIIWEWNTDSLALSCCSICHAMGRYSRENHRAAADAVAPGVNSERTSHCHSNLSKLMLHLLLHKRTDFRLPALSA